MPRKLGLVATARVDRLTGLEAEIYRYLASTRENSVLTRNFLKLGFKESDILEALIEKKLALVDSGSCLALAVDVTTSSKEC